MTRVELTRRLGNWLEDFGQAVVLATDSLRWDWPWIDEVFVCQIYLARQLRFRRLASLAGRMFSADSTQTSCLLPASRFVKGQTVISACASVSRPIAFVISSGMISCSLGMTPNNRLLPFGRMRTTGEPL
jgi:hypothetical protein